MSRPVVLRSLEEKGGRVDLGNAIFAADRGRFLAGAGVGMAEREESGARSTLQLGKQKGGARPVWKH